MGVILSLVISNLKGSIVCRIIIFSPRWLWFDLLLNIRILPNQRGFFKFSGVKIRVNSDFRVVVNRIGTGAYNYFTNAGIKVIATDVKNINDAISHYIKGKLKHLESHVD